MHALALALILTATPSPAPWASPDEPSPPAPRARVEPAHHVDAETPPPAPVTVAPPAATVCASAPPTCAPPPATAACGCGTTVIIQAPPAPPTGPAAPLPGVWRRRAAADPGPTTISGFTPGRRRVSFGFELGFPFLDTHLAYGLSDRVALGVGFRSLYGETSAPYAFAKLQLMSDAARTRGLALTVLGGYTYVRGEDEWDHDSTTALVGGDGVFAELNLGMTLRSGRHGLMVGWGLRLGQVKAKDCSGDSWCDEYSHVLDGRAGVLATVSAELGWEVKITRNAGYFISLGVDMFTNSKALPAMVRFRNGVVLSF